MESVNSFCIESFELYFISRAFYYKRHILVQDKSKNADFKKSFLYQEKTEEETDFQTKFKTHQITRFT